MRKAHNKVEKATECSDKKGRAGVSPARCFDLFSKVPIILLWFV